MGGTRQKIFKEFEVVRVSDSDSVKPAEVAHLFESLVGNINHIQIEFANLSHKVSPTQSYDAKIDFSNFETPVFIAVKSPTVVASTDQFYLLFYIINSKNGKTKTGRKKTST